MQPRAAATPCVSHRAKAHEKAVQDNPVAQDTLGARTEVARNSFLPGSVQRVLLRTAVGNNPLLKVQDRDQLVHVGRRTHPGDRPVAGLGNAAPRLPALPHGRRLAVALSPLEAVADA
ncbi:hypothetical protein [Streptomyces sp. NPDC051684]|uniref:hypothetical protein n=1 Tax=Streptomyces sp. NPDC051684 TaxID=3365670 RepID=UPI0037ABBB79